jgi:hypothetical protein
LSASGKNLLLVLFFKMLFTPLMDDDKLLPADNKVFIYFSSPWSTKPSVLAFCSMGTFPLWIIFSLSKDRKSSRLMFFLIAMPDETGC